MQSPQAPPPAPTALEYPLTRIAQPADQPPNANDLEPRISGKFSHRVGEQVGVYALEEPMGVGGFAEVWKALETTAGRRVALKIFFDHVMSDPSQAAVFLHEARKQARLEHERVTPIYYCHLDPRNGPGPYYIAMKLMPGGTLDALLRGRIQLPVPEALTIIRDVLQGLDVAHAAGIIHRDIKPRNVLFDKRGRATLADFGIAKDLGAETHTRIGTVMGTPEYMSPEQSMGQTVTRASDIYSVGVMLYEMLSGKPPYTGPTAIAVMLARKQKAPGPLYPEVPGVPAQLDKVVLKCLEEDPARRFGDCEALLQALDTVTELVSSGPAQEPVAPVPSTSPTSPLAASGAPPAVTPLVSSMPRPRSHSGRNYALVALATLVLLAGGWWLKTNNRTPAAVRPEPSKDVKTDRNGDLEAVQDWTKIAWNDPLLNNCRDFPPCVDRLRRVTRLKGLDFSKITRDASIRRDCAGWAPCLTVFPPLAPQHGRSEKQECTPEVAEFNLPATCPANDDFCKSCKQKQGIPDGTGMQK